MAIKRLDSEGIAALVGDEAAKRLQRKLLGGRSGYKGIRYETFFGAHRIARLIRRLIESGQDACVEWQSAGFVDDFSVRCDDSCSFAGYQLKNSASASWEAQITNDFANQHIISTAEGYTDIQLRLVCSDMIRARELDTSAPVDIAGYSKALYFPWKEPIIGVLLDHTSLADDFAYLSRQASPGLVEVEAVVSVIIGAWECEAPCANVSKIFQKARRTSPTLIRTLESDEQAKQHLDASFVEILDALPDFSYRIERGFLHWTAFGGSTKGTLSHDCFTEQFARLQKQIVSLQPRHVDDIEGFLI